MRPHRWSLVSVSGKRPSGAMVLYRSGSSNRDATPVRCRWMIEVYFRTLKSGCRIEERRFETLDRMLICLSIYMIVAWRTLYVCHLGRSCPDMDCDAIFESSEWRSVWSVSHPNEALPQKAPSLSKMVRMIAVLGGYVDRPNCRAWKRSGKARNACVTSLGPGKPSAPDRTRPAAEKLCRTTRALLGDR